jgi:hypothetical protein
MPAGHTNVIDRLEAEWRELCCRGALDEALVSWRRQEPSLAFANVDEIVQVLADRSANGEIHDRVLRPLLRLAPEDPLAARLVLIRFLPCLKKMAGWGEQFGRDEWTTLLVSHPYEVIATYPLERRPSRIAANIAWDVRKNACRALRTRHRQTAELSSCGRLRTCDRDPAAEEALARVEDADELSRAIDGAAIDPQVVELLVLTRAGGMTVEAVAADRCEPSARLRQRRWRAERRMAAVLAPN